jgi:hypothetical protein
MGGSSMADPASDVGDGGSGHEGWVQASQLSVIVHRRLSTDELVRDVARGALAAAIPTFLIDEDPGIRSRLLRFSLNPPRISISRRIPTGMLSTHLPKDSVEIFLGIDYPADTP